MTTPSPNADELVSAYLDGEATPDEIAQVESRPELLAQVEEMRAVSQLLAVTPSAPADQKEAHIAAALGAFDDLMGVAPEHAAATMATSMPAATAQADGAVVSLDRARAKRRPRRINALAAVAAAIAIVFLGVTALSLSTSSNSTDVADVALDKAAAGRAAAGDDDDESVAAAQAAPEAAFDGATESFDAEGADDAAMAEEAMAEEAPVEEAPVEAGALELLRPAEEPAAAAAEEADVDSDTAADSLAAPAPEAEEEAVELDDSAGADTGLFPADITTSELYLGSVTNLGELRLRLEQRSLVAPDIFEFETCQDRIAELEEVAETTLTALAFIDGLAVEIHQIPDSEAPLVLDRQTCEPVDELTP